MSQAENANSGTALRLSGLVLLLLSVLVLTLVLVLPPWADRQAQQINALATELAEGRRFAGPTALEQRNFPLFYRRDDNKILLLVNFASFGSQGQALVRYSAGGQVEAALGFGLSANAPQRLILQSLLAGQEPSPGRSALAISKALEAGAARVREGLPR